MSSISLAMHYSNFDPRKYSHRIIGNVHQNVATYTSKIVLDATKIVKEHKTWDYNRSIPRLVTSPVGLWLTTKAIEKSTIPNKALNRLGLQPETKKKIKTVGNTVQNAIFTNTVVSGLDQLRDCRTQANKESIRGSLVASGINIATYCIADALSHTATAQTISNRIAETKVAQAAQSVTESCNIDVSGLLKGAVVFIVDVLVNSHRN
jgi:hypothetical protein